MFKNVNERRVNYWNRKHMEEKLQKNLSPVGMKRSKTSINNKYF